MQFEYKTKGTCSQRIFFEIEAGNVLEAQPFFLVEADEFLVEYARQSGKPMLEWEDPQSAECFDNYNRFYENL